MTWEANSTLFREFVQLNILSLLGRFNVVLGREAWVYLFIMDTIIKGNKQQKKSRCGMLNLFMVLGKLCWKQEAHGPHPSPEKTVQINKHI